MRGKGNAAREAKALEPGWTIVKVGKSRLGETFIRYIPTTWPTEEAASLALADLLRPYPPHDYWRQVLSVRWMA